MNISLPEKYKKPKENPFDFLPFYLKKIVLLMGIK